MLRKRIMENDFLRMNDRQRQAVFHTEAAIDSAGAGSGKTTVLANRFGKHSQIRCAYQSTRAYAV